MTFRILLFSFTTFICLCTYFCSCDDSICQYWYSEEIVPSVISTAPTTLAEITFPCGASVEAGQEMTVKQLEALPQSVVYTYNPTALYTLIMFDTDAPSESNPYESQYVQWLVVNLDGQNALSNNLGAGDILASYSSPVPEANSGRHHYIFLIFLQTCRITVPPLAQRIRFNVESFASENSLGQAVAGNLLVVNTDI